MLRDVLAASADPLCVLDRKGMILLSSRSAVEVLGFVPGQIAGRDWRDQSDGANCDNGLGQRLDTLRRDTLETGQEMGTFLNLPSHDGRRDYEFTLSPVLDPEDQPAALLLQVRDVTVAAQIEMILRLTGSEVGFLAFVNDDETILAMQHWSAAAMGLCEIQDKPLLESIGQLSAGIAHEINTPILYVGDNITFLRDAFDELLKTVTRVRSSVEQLAADDPTGEVSERLQGDMRVDNLDFYVEEVPRAIAQSIEGVERVAAIVKAMKAFAHPGAAEKTATDIHQAILDTVTVARNRWKYVADLDTTFDPNMPLVPCMVGEFNQVILNLVVNAADAIAEARNEREGPRGKIQISTKKQGRWAEIRVRDSGKGIPQEIAQRVFEPFFTTKEVGKGSGQGLSLCHGIIVGKHGGTITFGTCPGRGTTFIVRIPLGESSG
jgi:PAS domain S-box-containing protein